MISPLRIRTFARPLFWAACVFAFVVAVIPNPPELPGAESDKLQHFAAFLVLALLGVAAYPQTKKRVILAGLAAFGALIEVVQALPVINRDSDPTDWIVDVIAALAVLASIAIWRLWKAR